MQRSPASALTRSTLLTWAVLAAAAAPGWAAEASSGPTTQQRWFDLGERSLPVHWTLPATARGAPRAALLLQHGFTRQCDRLRGTARALAAQGLAVLCLDADMAGGNPTLAREVAQALLDGRLSPDSAALPWRLIVGGHSAGALFALHVGAALHAAAPQRLAGALLLDPVFTRGGLAEQVLARVADGGKRPVTAVLAEPEACNAQGNATPALQRERHAAQQAGAPHALQLHALVGGTHLDAEGEDTTALAIAACGGRAPDPAAVGRLRERAAQAVDTMAAR